MSRFLEAQPPYTIETGKDAYAALLEIRGKKGFVRLGFGLASARLWAEKLSEVSKEGRVNRALKDLGYDSTQIEDLLDLGRGWTTDFESTQKDAKTQRVFRKLLEE
ncbi:hypothetical protein [Rubritalea tangerina]|uniref:hypothetical protein n=1 Tax=Rubritalea tangerina TaxID=430798 RepID=UPI003609BE96